MKAKCRLVDLLSLDASGSRIGKQKRPPTRRPPTAFRNFLNDRVMPAACFAAESAIPILGATTGTLGLPLGPPKPNGWRLATTSPMEDPWLTGLSSKVGNHWLQFPPKVVSQKLIKNRATRAALASCW